MDMSTTMEELEHRRLLELGATGSRGAGAGGAAAECACGTSGSAISVAAPGNTGTGGGYEEGAPNASDPVESDGQDSATYLRPGARGDGADDDDEDDDGVEADLFAQVDSLLKPVSATMALVVALVGVLNSSPVSAGAFSNMMVYEEHEEDSTGTKLAGSLENALIFIALIVGVTTLLFLLYKFHCTKLIYAWLITSVGMLLATFGGLVAYMIILRFDAPMDYGTSTFFLWNFAAVGMRVVFWPAPPIIRQVYLVIVSVLLAWSLTKLPEWTTWSILAAVSVWDLIAVLTPRGPLKGLVEESQRRNEPIPGLVYEADDVKLGLGDFVFYSVLIGRAVLHDVTTVVMCFIAILAGLGMTLLLLAIYQKALPALPISIALGMIFYFTTSTLVTPMVEELNVQGVFI